MSGERRALLINGSPKLRDSSSASIGEYIMGRASAVGAVTETFHAGRALRREAEWTGLVRAVAHADAVLLSFPLYWDSLPSHLIEALERLKTIRSGTPPTKPQTLYAAVQNGFPEPWHNEVAIDICRQFSKEAGFIWGGAINLGGGGAINGVPLEQTGGMTIKLRQALDTAARAIAACEPFSPDLSQRLEIPLSPKWITTLFGGFLWRRRAKREGVKGPMNARPY